METIGIFFIVALLRDYLLRSKNHRGDCRSDFEPPTVEVFETLN